MSVQLTKTTKDRVKDILTRYPKTKDNDHKLITYFWFDELKDLDIVVNNLPTNEFFHYLIDGKVTNPESIRRIRAILQSDKNDDCEKWRGPGYKARARKSDVIKDQVNTLYYI